MELLHRREVANVKLFTIEVTEDELDVYERCMRYLDNTMLPEQIEITCGTYQDELRAIYAQVSILLENHTNLRRKNKS